jgi:hypothetical protein
MRGRVAAIAIAASLLVVSAGVSVAAMPDACRIQGTRIHWTADYCMALNSTDDEIVAGECINDQLARSFVTDCEAVIFYKRAMCSLAKERGSPVGSVEQCLSDPQFKGPTVRASGVGG